MPGLFDRFESVFGDAIHSGIKAEKKDLSFIYVPSAVASAGVFTKNKFAAPSIVWTKRALKKNVMKAIVINSGNANAGTGMMGLDNTKTMAKEAALSLGLRQTEVGVASTGVIGVQLPMDGIKAGIRRLLSQSKVKNPDAVAEGIMTTDTYPKKVTLSRKIGKKTITVSGLAKGSGMIAPNMATMLAFLITDATVSSSFLQNALDKAVGRSFNSISVDTDTSTSDMVLFFATGERAFSVSKKEECAQFQMLVDDVCIALAKEIICDGEGATKCIEVQVSCARSVKEAKEVAFNIVDSPLVKTAIHGEDPNWGRLIMAIGKSYSVPFNPNMITVSLQGVVLFSKGMPAAFDEAVLKTLLEKKDVLIEVDLKMGDSQASVWGCDLTKAYIDINTDYN